MASVVQVANFTLHESRHLNACRDMSSFPIAVTSVNHSVGASSCLAVVVSILLQDFIDAVCGFAQSI